MRPSRTAAIVLVLLVAGCGELIGVGDLVGQPPSDAGPQSSTDTLVPPLAAREAGVVIVDSDGSTVVPNTSRCAGVLLTNEWVLTAGHCIPKFSYINGTNPPRLNRDQLVPPEALTVTSVDSSYVSAVDRYHFFGGFPGFEPIEGGDSRRCMADAWEAPDLALLHLATAMPVDGRSPGYSLPIYTEPSDKLTGVELATFRLDADGAIFESRAKVRTRAPDKAGAARLLFELSPAAERLPLRGSGPEFIFDRGAWRLASMHTGHLWKCGLDDDPFTCSGHELRCPDSGRIDHQVVSASLAELIDWLEAIRLSGWEAGQSFTAVPIRDAELRAQPENMSFPEHASWGVATHMAERMCFNRGFAGGYFSGTKTDPGAQSHLQYELTCFTRDVAIWHPLAPRALANAGIDSLDGLNWLPAARAANTLCRQFEEHAPITYGGGFLNRIDGMFCLRTEHTIAGLEMPIVNAASLSWFEAGHAATGYCVSRGYRAGLPSGTAAEGRLGALCFL